MVGCEADKDRENFTSLFDANNELNPNSLWILKEKQKKPQRLKLALHKNLP